MGKYLHKWVDSNREHETELINKRKRTSWYRLNKRIASGEITVKEYNTMVSKKAQREQKLDLQNIEQESIERKVILSDLSLRELQRMYKNKRMYKSIKRVDDSYISRKPHKRYYMFAGILYPYINGVIPYKHRKRLKKHIAKQTKLVNHSME